MRCVVPNCKNQRQEWLAPFPTDMLLMYRWKECIEIGSGLRLPDMETISEQDGVCSMHFLGFSPEDESSYRQPSLFFRDNIVLEIEHCCLCCRMNIKEDMLEKSDCLREDHSIEEIVDKFAGSLCFDKKKSAEYICEECVVKIDMVYAFQRQIASGKRELKKLHRRMMSENVCFQRQEDEQIEEHAIEISIELIDNVSSKDDENEIEEIVDPNTTAKSARKPRKRTLKQKQQNDQLFREKLEKSRLKCYICGIYSESTDFLLNHLMLTHTEQDALHCEECGISFERSPEYNAHLAKHDADVRPFKCSYCPLRFAKAAGKTVHEDEHHNTESEKRSRGKKPRAKNYMCQICGGTYRSQSDLNRHDIVQHKGETFVTCKTCNKSFASMRNLKRHLLIHRGERPYACKICGVSYRQSQNLLDHMNEKHREESSELKYACNECDTRFASHRILQSHRKIHEASPMLAGRNGGESSNKTVCNVCDMLFEKSSLILEHFSTEHPDLQLEHYPCSTCGEVFFRKQNLLVHSYNHSDRFACDECGRRHNTQAKMEIHRYKVHGAQIADQYFDNCPHCDKKCPKGNELARHIKTHFEGRWRCEACDRNFTEKFHLTIHMRKHTGERPLVCTSCDARFGDPTVLSKHKKRCELSMSKQK